MAQAEKKEVKSSEILRRKVGKNSYFYIARYCVACKKETHSFTSFIKLQQVGVHFTCIVFCKTCHLLFDKRTVLDLYSSWACHGCLKVVSNATSFNVTYVEEIIINPRESEQLVYVICDDKCGEKIESRLSWRGENFKLSK